MTWERVTHKQPCEICGKPDWCTRSELGACCMRVQTDRPMKNGGGLHSVSKSERFPHTTRIPAKNVKSLESGTVLDFDQMLSTWRKLGLDHVQWFASQLGLKEKSFSMRGAAAGG